MDRRSFAKKTLGVVAAGLATVVSAEEKDTNASKKVKRTLRKYSDLPSNKANEQIKVIQAKRGFQNNRIPIKPKPVCTSLLFFADVHVHEGAEENLVRISQFHEEYKKYIDDAVHLGDSGPGVFKGKFDSWDYFPNALNVIGNHDVYFRKLNKKHWLRENWLTSKEAYDVYFKRYIDQWKVVQPENAEAEGKCYWYKDYQKHLRLIGIDCMYWNDPKQLEWFKATLEDACSKKLKIAIATHVPPDSNKFVECAFTTIDYSAGVKKYDGGDSDLDKYVEAVDTFIENGGIFVSWICGHAHRDMIMFANSKQKQLIIVIECATDFMWWTDANHVRGTETAAAWEIIAIESHTNILKIVRFGNNFDHQMRHKGTLCYDFINHKIIAQS